MHSSRVRSAKKIGKYHKPISKQMSSKTPKWFPLVVSLYDTLKILGYVNKYHDLPFPSKALPVVKFQLADP